MSASSLVLTRETEPTPETVEAISDGLTDYNAAFAPRSDWRSRYLLGRDAEGALQSGAKYLLAFDWLFVEWLWVAEPWRRQREGSRLLAAMEAHAAEAGCLGAYLDTFSFQAPLFYAKQGYSEFGRIADFPVGHARIWLMKRF